MTRSRVQFLLLLCLGSLVPTTAEGSSPSWDRLFHWTTRILPSSFRHDHHEIASSSTNETNTTPSPSLAPPHSNQTNETGTFVPTMAPSSSSHNGTHPGNATTLPPHPSNETTTFPPTPEPPHHNETTITPHNSTTTVAPTPSASNHTQPPSPLPPPHPSNHTANHTTVAPTPYSHPPHPTNHSVTGAPTAAPSDEVVPKMSFWKILSKTIAWLIFIGLSVLAFGGIMSHRYRIYFFLRGVWYTIVRMECTQWIFRKLRFGDQQVDSGLNTIIFDSEMSEGLLLNENRHDA